ncbi:Pentatricopeptide repeat-containing protein [Camellia lanceoleosa]|uniref:Pentatricopeptide repeat-containing protein n=1 Tax=Camellia lanceoleosa TaxID=1840588 RepID=A0ACC0F3N0_9ERIC|nr:Pentatricopeptide repeat-containing protein [Camellia lanceoleosa]
MESAFSVFGEMTERDVRPNVDTYYPLVSGLRKVGRMERVNEFVDEILKKGIELGQVGFNTMINVCCKEGMIDEALGLHVIMQKKGFMLDVFLYDMISNRLCELGQMDEAKTLLSIMVKRSVTFDMGSFTNFLGRLGHCGSEKAVSEEK